MGRSEWPDSDERIGNLGNTVNESRPKGLGKPTFWSYVITSRSYNLYKGNNDDTYYTPKRNKVMYVFYWMMPALIILTRWLPMLLSGADFWDYRLDLFILVILLVPLLVLLDYKLTKFEQTRIAWHNVKQKNAIDRNRVISIILVSLVPIIVIYAFLNTFSFNWLRSQIDEKRDVNLITYIVGDDIYEFDKSANEIVISSTRLVNGSLRLNVESERTSSPIELLLNGKVYQQENAFVTRSVNSIWEETYFAQQYIYYLLPADMEDENSVVIRCGDIEKEYILLKIGRAHV